MIWVLIIAIVILAGGAFTLSWLSKVSFFRIDSVRIEGADPDIATSLRTAAESAISGSYFGLFSKANSLIYPRGAVVRAVKEASGRIEDVVTSLNDMHQISITVTEKTPSALVCPNFPNMDSSPDSLGDGDCFFVDKAGLIYAVAPDLSSGVYNRYYTPDISGTATSTSSPIGSYATSTEGFVRLQAFYNGAQSAGLEVESVLIKDKGEYEMYILNPDKSIAIIYFNESRPLTDELSNLLSFWNYMVTDTHGAKNPPSFDYMDVRYGTNVFYRVNGGAASSNKSK